MVTVKPGARLQSRVCTTEVIVVSGSGELDLRCGGSPMAPVGTAAVEGPPAPGAAEGTQLGKRYGDPDATVEVLCTKAGEGSLALGDTPLAIKATRQLPASD